MTKIGIYLVVIALLVAELFKILIYANKDGKLRQLLQIEGHKNIQLIQCSARPKVWIQDLVVPLYINHNVVATGQELLHSRNIWHNFGCFVKVWLYLTCNSRHHTKSWDIGESWKNLLNFRVIIIITKMLNGDGQQIKK